MKRKLISPRDLKLNLYSGDLLRGALLCSGTLSAHNCMTINWATLGVMWNRKVFTVYVRPTRHTFSFIERDKDFTVNFFGSEYREILAYCGTYSGRDVDKLKECGLTAVPSKKVESPTLDEAQLVLECRTIYTQSLDPHGFMDKRIDEFYPDKDYHHMYFGFLQAIYGTARFLESA